MRGSILVTFDELVNDRGIDNYQLTVGTGSDTLRDVHFTDSNKLYSTYVFTGDSVTFTVFHSTDLLGDITIKRIDYTTDDEGGDYGIKEVIISPTLIFASSSTAATFTGSTVPSAYNFKYLIEATTKIICFTFGTGFNEVVDHFAIQPDRNVVVSGNYTSYNGVSSNRIRRLNFDGSIDNTFNIGTGFDGLVKVITRQSDGKILACGTYSTYNGIAGSNLIRLNTDGSKDATFNPAVTGNQDVKVQSDGKILTCGSGGSIARLNSNGTTDATFSLTGVTAATFDNMSILSDGKILTATSTGSVYELFRLNSNGGKDTTFTDGSFNGFIETIALQSDGKILIGGFFAGTGMNRILRLNSDGTVDSTFNIGTGFNDEVYTIYIQTDGKILVGGAFTSYNGTDSNRIIRLNSDGSIDSTFNIGTGFNDDVRYIDVESNSRIYVGGVFTTYNGVSSNRIIRLNMNGSSNTCLV
jgi:uncharacterized delta-60 repeat protein